MRDLCSDGNVLYLDYVNINILVVILYYSFARCYHWGKLGKGWGGGWNCSVLFLTIAGEPTIISK